MSRTADDLPRERVVTTLEVPRGERAAARRASLADWHGRLLVLAAACVPVGEGLALGALVALMLKLVVRRRELPWEVLRRGPAMPTVVAFGVWLAAGAVAIVVGGEGWLKPGELGRWVPLLTIPVVGLTAPIVPHRYLRQAVTAFVALLAVSCLFGLVQYGFNVRPGESLSRQASGMTSQARVPGQWDRTVAGGFYFHRLKLAHVLLVGIAGLAGRQLYAAMSRRQRVVELGLVALFVTTFFLTYARGAILALAAGVLLLLAFAGRRLVLATVPVLVLGAALVFAVPSIRHRIESIGSQDASSVRALIWSQAVRVIADHPLGVGIGNFTPVVDRYYETSSPAFGIRTYPHNVWLAAWAETGPVGLAAYLAAWLLFLGACARAVVRRGPAAPAAAAGLFGIGATLVVGLTHDVLFHNSVALAVAGLVGVVGAFIARGDGTGPASDPARLDASRPVTP
jgi:O-antigen ligase